jgi:hypothetical protein
MSKSEIHVATNGARVEVGTYTHEGRDFAALGSVVDEARGILCAYVTRREDGSHVLSTWGGETLAPLVKTGTWLNRNTFGGFPVRMFAWRCTYQGRSYSGRNAGDGMLLRMRTKVAS